MLTFSVPVQSAFTVVVPLIVSWATWPPVLLFCAPEKLPAASNVNLPTSAKGTAPVGKMNAPVEVYPHSPARPGVEQMRSSCAGATAAKLTQSMAEKRIERTILRIMFELLFVKVTSLHNVIL